MNTVTIADKSSPIYKAGAIFRDESSGEMYILGSYGKSGKVYWLAICLNDGQSWNNVSESEEEAAEGLDFVGMDMRIALS